MKKTNALRILDKHKIAYEQVSYTYNPENLNVEEIAKSNKLDVKTIFKTLVVKGDRSGTIVAVIPGNRELNLRALALASRNKKVTFIPVKEIQSITGYIRGGCSPLGMKKKFSVFIDKTGAAMKKIYVNAGERGSLFGISPADLTTVTNAKVVEISNEKETTKTDS